MRSPAFQVRRQPPRKVDPNPHTLTLEERERATLALQDGRGASVELTRKLIRLYDERTAACHQLMKSLGML